MKRILIIDDEPKIRKMLREFLEAEGYTVLDASNGYEGIDLFNRWPADLVITDLIMPKKEGLETISELKQVFPHVKIIAISGGCQQFSCNSFLPIAKYLGADSVMAKPIFFDDLLLTVTQLLR